jgi:hypothetical protein
MKPICNKCEHYYITWEKKFPNGCRSMSFKSRELPSLAVRKNSGMDCLQFKIKKQKKIANRGYIKTKLI